MSYSEITHIYMLDIVYLAFLCYNIGV